MDALLIVNDILSFIFVPIAIFLGSEFLKKFRFMKKFVENSNQMVIYHHLGNKAHKPGMYNIVLQGRKPFCALVGFRLNIPIIKFSGYDYYGFVQSNDGGYAVISTYLGNGECEFQFLVNSPLDTNPIFTTCSENDQLLTPDVVYKPHWWQKIGFFS